MATRRTKPVAARGKHLVRPFLPRVDLVDPAAAELEDLSADDKRRLIQTKIADVTHFRVDLAGLHRHVEVARALATEARSLPREIRGVAFHPGRAPAARVSVQPARPGGAPVGRGVVTDASGLFTLPIPALGDDVRKEILDAGLGLRFTGVGNAVRIVTIPAPPSDARAIGEVLLDGGLEPLPESVVGALIDLVDDLPSATPTAPTVGEAAPPVQIQIGQEACSIVFEEDVALRRFPYQILVRLVEPRATTVNRVFVPGASSRAAPASSRRSGARGS